MNAGGIQEACTRVLVPFDCGLASGGFGPLRFPWSMLAVICTPWTWPVRIARLLEPLRNHLRSLRGQAPLGYEYRDFPSSMTLFELVEHLGYSVEGTAYLPRFSAYGHRPIDAIPSGEITEAIKDVQSASW